MIHILHSCKPLLPVVGKQGEIHRLFSIGTGISRQTCQAARAKDDLPVDVCIIARRAIREGKCCIGDRLSTNTPRTKFHIGK